ncbi:PIG-L family deacetylase [Cognatiyoonia sp. IB215182]|uniref:PIG-L family deacetylase n=1 Tax=Cognatiyoonia sp. IB215182 TaxID=3097353 RepID=UPI002A145AEA|nr:PIG-L family deacetylase [Cognatiyoonia sp. IB215182]MDX8354028.1 PIG-L family deacetylase [Cognatiyoonia sp. IB215182]
MPTPDQTLIAHDRARPRLMELWWALRPLTSVVRFMQTGAHPDDEISGMLAALAFRDGINISYACSTRGEGGQNDIGTEAGRDLGALRTREMERACDILGMRMYWHSTHPDDTITDFGFSKSGQETLGRWGRERTMLRFVEIVRTEKPDIICPTFLDVPGQHGHHRAMTEAAHAVMAAAADPAFSTNLPIWQVKKLYLPAWSGAGQAYDDDLPPPPATMTIPGKDREPMTGWNWNRIGEQSRAYHRTQGMGRWKSAGPGQDWPLHLAESHVDGPDEAVWTGMPRTVGDLAALPGAEPIADALQSAQSAIDAAVDSFPHFARVADNAAEAVTHVRAAHAACPVALSHEISHRLDAKLIQLAQVIRLALGVEARARTSTAFVEAGSEVKLTTEIDPGTASTVETTLNLPEGWTSTGDEVVLGSETPVSNPYRTFYDPIAPAAPHLDVTIAHHGTKITVPVACENELVVIPRERVSLTPSASILNINAPNRTIMLAVSDLSPADATIDLALPSGWSAERNAAGFAITAPADVEAGLYRVEARVNGKPAETVRLIEYDHVAQTASTQRAEVTIGVFDVALPEGRVGYVGAGNDRVGEWLGAMGADVTSLSDDDLASEATLATYDAIVIGIFAMRFRPGLTDAVPALHRWTEAGGTLVTLYHRPWDNWDPDTVPPKRLEIGQPSLRWRVTDEAATVTQLNDHSTLSSPNLIGATDWDGWVKERGLYFAKSWDPAYTPLLSMSDPGEDPLTGALLVADIGKGRHIHTSLILHHQMENLVPGAFRLMANFIAARQ